jgi:nitrite reductase (NADH) large subunit
MERETQMKQRLLIIGNGMAGLRLVEELVTQAPGRFAITIVGKEPVPAYNRILLSSVLAGDVGRDEVNLRTTAWYDAYGITLITGDPVASVDTTAQTASLVSGRDLAWDRLVFATGSTAIRLPMLGIDLPGVVTFRDFDDLDQIAAAKKGASAIVIGGGLLGIEAAYGLAKRGLDTTLVHLMDTLMERQLDARAAALLRDAVEARGVRVILDALTTAVEGTNRVEGVRLRDGRVLPAGLVVCAVGIRAETGIAAKAGITCGRGIEIDDRLQTSVSNVYAIGECAEHRGVCYGLVEPAYDQARVLAAHLADDNASRYTGSVVATNLKVSGVNVFSVGEFMGDEFTEQIVLSDAGLGAYRKLVLRRDATGQARLVGAVLFGDVTDSLWYQDLIRNASPVDHLRPDLIFGRAFVQAAEAA